MKKIIYLLTGVFLFFISSCDPQLDDVGDLGSPPISGTISIDNTDQHYPIFKAVADDGFIYHWNLGNNQSGEGQIISSYYPFEGDYEISCRIAGTGGIEIIATTTYNVTSNDPEVANLPVWKELTESGAGKTWVYNTDTTTGFPDYCYQTGGQAELDLYPEAWSPGWSWGQCVRITPDINGEMIFDLNEGLNYTYHQTAGDAGVKGSFILDTDNMTLTITNPHILDYNIDCTNPSTTSTGVYEIKLLTDTELVLWQDQLDASGTGWGWSFKKKE